MFTLPGSDKGKELKGYLYETGTNSDRYEFVIFAAVYMGQNVSSITWDRYELKNRRFLEPYYNCNFHKSIIKHFSLTGTQFTSIDNRGVLNCPQKNIRFI